MSDDPAKCPKCKGEMVQGFIIDWTQAGRMVSSWAEGAPVKSFWSGTKIADGKTIPVGTYCCSNCGFLESYARDEFAAR